MYIKVKIIVTKALKLFIKPYLHYIWMSSWRSLHLWMEKKSNRMSSHLDANISKHVHKDLLWSVILDWLFTCFNIFGFIKVFTKLRSFFFIIRDQLMWLKGLSLLNQLANETSKKKTDVTVNFIFNFQQDN